MMTIMKIEDDDDDDDEDEDDVLFACLSSVRHVGAPSMCRLPHHPPSWSSSSLLAASSQLSGRFVTIFC